MAKKEIGRRSTTVSIMRTEEGGERHVHLTPHRGTRLGGRLPGGFSVEQKRDDEAPPLVVKGKNTFELRSGKDVVVKSFQEGGEMHILPGVAVKAAEVTHDKASIHLPASEREVTIHMPDGTVTVVRGKTVVKQNSLTVEGGDGFPVIADDGQDITGAVVTVNGKVPELGASGDVTIAYITLDSTIDLLVPQAKQDGEIMVQESPGVIDRKKRDEELALAAKILADVEEMEKALEARRRRKVAKRKGSLPQRTTIEERSGPNGEQERIFHHTNSEVLLISIPHGVRMPEVIVTQEGFRLTDVGNDGLDQGIFRTTANVEIPGAKRAVAYGGGHIDSTGYLEHGAVFFGSSMDISRAGFINVSGTSEEGKILPGKLTIKDSKGGSNVDMLYLNGDAHVVLAEDLDPQKVIKKLRLNGTGNMINGELVEEGWGDTPDQQPDFALPAGVYKKRRARVLVATGVLLATAIAGVGLSSNNQESTSANQPGQVIFEPGVVTPSPSKSANSAQDQVPVGRESLPRSQRSLPDEERPQPVSSTHQVVFDSGDDWLWGLSAEEYEDANGEGSADRRATQITTFINSTICGSNPEFGLIKVSSPAFLKELHKVLNDPEHPLAGLIEDIESNIPENKLVEDVMNDPEFKEKKEKIKKLFEELEKTVKKQRV